jgi:SAM-dependent methyltransferase
LTETYHYAGGAVDLGSRDLPGLKADFMVSRVQDDSVVVDVGCGGGKMLRTITRHHPGVRVRGCDIVEGADVGDDFEFSLIDTETQRLPYEDSSADFVLLVDVLDHTDRPQELLGEIARILRPDGKLLAFVGIEGERLGWYRVFRSILGDDLYRRAKDHSVAFTHAQLQQMLAADFVVTERRYAYHFFGHLMDAALWAAMTNAWVSRTFWAHSPYHGEGAESSSGGSLLGRIVSALFKVANAAAWAESRALRNVRATSAGVLLVATPKK